MTEQVVSVGFGRETFSKQSVALSAFIVADGFERTLPSKKYPRQGRVQEFPASLNPEINGSLYLDTVRIPDGAVLLLQSRHTRGASAIRDGGLFIALRSTGPMLAIKATLPVANEAIHTGDFLVFQGKGDILSRRELADYGITPPSGWASSFLSKEEVDECYVISELSPGAEAKPRFDRVRNVDGETVAVKQQPGRRVRLRNR